ncbi:MAG: UDP-N-acetylmuramoyl-L-alanyl-D-glutamate--2,6-diaminopimelate ligase [Ruminococcus sp.]|uniref:UDP-N-acetylmuramoyl-L-alanyl-D-glutamate--2, 6-diaminopimelate ligase n=1 Tax=Ruminococcus sp. TaxID=41978 RepID=UPI0025E019F7|nr:UDP-N-acetylmuramoyl-L-alanyl-D-glutamate--2,6-diaminopimelate ligase [Ruminococcus sp.]MBO4868031.1 UDP-N-acetylmuramoyl-L-alanyl-D-glutamate--2,6-diaminopimelate ligase [Ruminococcus sp.]
MRLYELINEVAETTLPDMEITGLTSDTRGKVTEGSIFVCIKGKTFDGHDAAKQMLEKGCAAVVCERDLGLERQIIVEDTRAAFPMLCAAWFRHPERELELIGVTGTNGKTTITTVIKKVLSGFGCKVGLIGTCQNEIGDEIIPTARTTPEPYDLFELFRKMADAGCKYTVMEVSSQGLEQKRVQGCHFRVGVFTNLTQDHLDVHGTMENYYQAKKMLFDICDTAIINIDDKYGERYTKEIPCPFKTYSVSRSADYRAEDIMLGTDGVKYVFCDGKVKKNVSFNMPGLFNVSNSLAVIACMEELGYTPCKTIAGFEKIQGVRGRAEIIPTGRDFTVICDYAHTPDALINVLSAIKESSKGKVKCLFGCGGNRDRTKRAPMAAAAAEHADFLIVTSDNPRDEDPDDIINDVLKGLEGKDTPYVRMTDRREAIHWAIKNAEKDDIIVLAGKGHEDYQILAGGVKIHFDEREVVAEALKEL